MRGRPALDNARFWGIVLDIHGLEAHASYENKSHHLLP